MCTLSEPPAARGTEAHSSEGGSIPLSYTWGPTRLGTLKTGGDQNTSPKVRKWNRPHNARANIGATDTT